MRVSRSAVALAVGFVAASITITPTSHDFGNVAVNGVAFKAFPVGGLRATDSATGSLTGPDADQFIIGPSSQGGVRSELCRVDLADAQTCGFDVLFSPKSKGPKSATLVVKDFRGGRATAALKGNGVEAVCEMKVVSCNYAHLYSGVFSWNDGLQAAGSSTSIVMQADIDGLNVACNGTETIRDEGGSHVLISKGSGLVAVEFKTDDENRSVYNITVACPTPGNSDNPSQRAELGHFDQQTYDQLKTKAGPPKIPNVENTLIDVTPGVDLIGTTSYPNPGVDAVNGVTGTVVVTWKLKRK